MRNEDTEEATSATSAVRDALARFDRTFASGDADALAELFAADAQLLLLHGEPIEGRAAIREHWTRLFAAYDPGAWIADPLVVEVHGDRAYTLSVYSETLVHRGGGASLVVRGRLIFFMRRDPDDTWRVSVVVNSHIRPVERLESDSAKSDDA